MIMIRYLRGHAVNETVLLTPGGVGYDLQLLQPMEVGANYDLWIYHYTSKDGISRLYGFSDLREREVFAGLLKESGVGPALAFNLLRGLGMAEVVRAISEGDQQAIAKTAGVGPKSAPKVMGVKFTGDLIKQAQETAEPADSRFHELTIMLTNLGFRAEDVSNAVRQVLADAEPDAEVEDLVRPAVAAISQAA